jgi:predicted Zn-dependent peptidase
MERFFTLDNGMKVYIKKNNYCKNIVKVQSIYNFGSNAETEKYRGCAHMIEHLIFKGTKYLKMLPMKDLRLDIGDQLYNKLRKNKATMNLFKISKSNSSSRELDRTYLYHLEKNFDVKLFDNDKKYNRQNVISKITAHYDNLLENKKGKFRNVNEHQNIKGIKEAHLNLAGKIFDFYDKYERTDKITDETLISREDMENFVIENVKPSLVTDVLTRSGCLYLSESDIDNIAREYGAKYNAFTNNSTTSYFFDVNKNVYHLFLQILASSCTNTDFDNDFINSEVGAVIQEMKHGQDDADRQAFYKMNEVMFDKDTTMHYSTIGDENCLLSQNASKLRSFYNKLYSPQNCTLLITGDIDVLQAENYARRYFSAIKNSGTVFKIEEKKHDLENYKPSYDLVETNVAQKKYMYSYPFFNNKNDYHKGNAFSIGLNDRLQKRLQYELGLVTSVGAFSYQGSENGVFTIEFTPANDEKIPQIDSVIMDVIDSNWSNTEIENIKKTLNLQFRMKEMRLEDFSSTFVDQVVSTSDITHVNIDPLGCEYINPKSFSEICSTYLDVLPSKITIVPAKSTSTDEILHAPKRYLPLIKPHSFQLFKDTDVKLFEKEDYLIDGISYNKELETVCIHNPALKTVDFTVMDSLHDDLGYQLGIEKVKDNLIVSCYNDYHDDALKKMKTEGFFADIGFTKSEFSYVCNENNEKFNELVQQFNNIVAFDSSIKNDELFQRIFNTNKISLVNNLNQMNEDAFSNCIHFCKQTYLGVSHSIDYISNHIADLSLNDYNIRKDTKKKISYSSPKCTTTISSFFEPLPKTPNNTNVEIQQQLPYLNPSKRPKKLIKVKLTLNGDRKQTCLMLSRQSLFNKSSKLDRSLKPLLETIAFSGLGSRLYHIRETTGLFYSAHSRNGVYSDMKNNGFDYITLQCFPDKVDRAIDELKHLVSSEFWELNPITQQELDSAKAICYNQLYSTSTYNNISDTVLRIGNLYGEKFNDHVKKSYDAFKDVNLEELNEFAAFFFQNPYEHIIIS